MAKTNVVCKICKVYPAKNKRISGILPNQKMITEPGIYHLNLKEIRRCMSYGDVFEVVTGGDVLLTQENYHLDNSKAKVYPADKVPAIADQTIHYGVHKPAEEATDPTPSAPAGDSNASSQPATQDLKDDTKAVAEENAVDTQAAQAVNVKAANNNTTKNTKNTSK